MKNGNNAKRRNVLLSILGSGLLVAHGGALALSKLSPPEPRFEEHLRDADLVIVGVLKRYVYMGSDITDRIENDLDFDSDKVGRARHAFVTVKKTLATKLEPLRRETLRIYAPSIRQGGTDWDEKARLTFALKKGETLPSRVPLFYCLVPPFSGGEARVRAAL